MKSNKSTAFIIITGVIILIIFTATLSINFINSKESNSYYVKVGDDMSSKIENVNIIDDKLVIETSGDPIKFCVKSQRFHTVL